MFDYGFIATPEQKLEEFVAYNNGRLELRFKVPVNKEQVAEGITTLCKYNTIFLLTTPKL